jgi:hypothetical protein
MDASQFWYTEIVHLGSKHEFIIFYALKVSEMHRNTPNHHFRSNRLEWMLHNFGTRNSAFMPETQVFTSFYLSKVSEML